MIAWHGIGRRLRGVAGLAGVLLFLSGGNFCLISSLSGSPMSCLAVPSDPNHEPSPGTEPPSRGGCGHGPSSTGQGTPGTSSSCCLTILQTSVPSVAKAEPTLERRPMLAAADLAIPVALGAALEPSPDESPPPERHPPASHRGRAPPLS